MKIIRRLIEVLKFSNNNYNGNLRATKTLSSPGCLQTTDHQPDNNEAVKHENLYQNYARKYNSVTPFLEHKSNPSLTTPYFLKTRGRLFSYNLINSNMEDVTRNLSTSTSNSQEDKTIFENQDYIDCINILTEIEEKYKDFTKDYPNIVLYNILNSFYNDMDFYCQKKVFEFSKEPEKTSDEEDNKNDPFYNLIKNIKNEITTKEHEKFWGFYYEDLKRTLREIKTYCFVMRNLKGKCIKVDKKNK